MLAELTKREQAAHERLIASIHQLEQEYNTDSCLANLTKMSLRQVEDYYLWLMIYGPSGYGGDFDY